MLIITPLSSKGLIPFITSIFNIILFLKCFHALAKLFSSVKALCELHGSLNVVFTLFSCSGEPTQKGQTLIHFSERHILEPKWGKQWFHVQWLRGKKLSEWVPDKMSKIKTNWTFRRWFWSYQPKLVYTITHDF